LCPFLLELLKDETATGRRVRICGREKEGWAGRKPGMSAKVVRKLLSIQHRFNPLHLYCRFLQRGLTRERSMMICRFYEVLVFFWLSYLIKVLIRGYCCVNRSCSVREEIRKA
jgi:hypothetical protein